jgi:hypothetical protein
MREELVARPQDGPAVIFAGVPRFSGGEAVLFDSSTAPDQLPPSERLSRLVVRLDGGVEAAPVAIDADVVILLYVDDLTTPRARVRLADVLRQGGERPLNVRRQRGQTVRVVLIDPKGSLAGRALEVALA